MTVSSRTPEGAPNHCPVCKQVLRIEPSAPTGDAPCPNCGSLLWFAQAILGDELALLSVNDIVPDLRAKTKQEAIRETVARLSATGAIRKEQEEGLVQAVLRREDLGSTGIGDGFAVPHAEHPSIAAPVGAMAISPKGIDFDALDGQPVHYVFLFAYPTGQRVDHLRALERISSWARMRGN